ncbi:DUF6148 family protein [Paenibacillus daejeonensis]|uniref:DUF6148 family protein n=1 Tax=Paenibacillus daejeonensis TaxID=135193 RepID=UPI00037947C5|nr:DUF6148 family protein [Paenibacillus daejeonensis]
MKYTLEVATTHLNAWLACELAISTGQSYTIGTRSLTRANLKEVMQQIKYWQGIIDGIIRCKQGLPPRSRVRRYVPLDI